MDSSISHTPFAPDSDFAPKPQLEEESADGVTETKKAPAKKTAAKKAPAKKTAPAADEQDHDPTAEGCETSGVDHKE